jgi:hypothetical protein
MILIKIFCVTVAAMLVLFGMLVGGIYLIAQGCEQEETPNQFSNHGHE